MIEICAGKRRDRSCFAWIIHRVSLWDWVVKDRGRIRGEKRREGEECFDKMASGFLDEVDGVHGVHGVHEVDGLGELERLIRF